MGYSNFNRVAFIYDFLARLIFGNKLKLAQTVFLEHLKEGDKVLIIGGGTGWILEEINKLGKSITIVYIEPSSKMMALSKSRKAVKNLTIQFIGKPFLNVDEQSDFDVVCTFFFLDLFEKKDLLKTIDKIKGMLKTNGKWLFADFSLNNKSPFLHKLLVKWMYVFFKITASISSKELQDYIQMIQKFDFEIMDMKNFKKGLIMSSVLLKE